MKKLKKSILLTLVLTFFAISANAFSMPFYLGKVSLAEHTDIDVINLPRCITPRNRLVSKIKFIVRKYPAQIDRLTVQFYNNGRQELYVRKHFRRGQGSRWIDLRFGKRCIKRIIVRGDTDSFGHNHRKQAKIFFWGR